MSPRPYQIVVYGGTGFAGRLVCEHIASDYQGKIRWALAGRSKTKLEELRADLVKINPACKDVPILDADSSKQETLDKTASMTDVMITTVGPYAKLGLPVVKACAANGTHYCDLTGETHFVRNSIRRFDQQAKDTGAKILHCCGYDSIPSDLATLQAVHFAIGKYGRPPTELTLLQEGKGGVSGGTIDSGIGLMRESPEDRAEVAKPYAMDPPGSLYADGTGPDSASPVAPTWSEASQGWTSMFIMAMVNEAVVRRSNALLGYVYGTEFKYNERTGCSSYPAAIAVSGLMVVMGGFLVAAARLPFLRRLLPAAGSGPDLETRTNGFWKASAYALVHDADGVQHRQLTVLQDPNRDPGYASTSRMLLETALCLALDQEDLKKDPYASKCPAGILTPASALGLVLMRRLLDAGITCECRELS